MNEKERKELARIVADCCKPCSKRIGAWMKSHKPQGARPKVKGLTARDLAAFLGAMPKAAGNLIIFRAGFGVEGTDGEAWTSFKCPVKGKGEAIVDGRAVARWLHVQKSAPVTLTVEDTPANETGGVNGLTVEAGGVAARFLKAINLELPKAPTGKIGKVERLGDVRADALGDAVKSVAFCASQKELRYAMNGIAFDGDTLAATNGCALAFSRVSPTLKAAGKGHIPIFPIYHAKSLLVVLRRNGEEEVSVWRIVHGKGKAGREYMAFTGARASLTVCAVEGRFPAWGEVVPKQEPTAALELDARELAEGLLSIAALNDDEEYRSICLSVNGERVKLTHGNGRKEEIGIQGHVNGNAGKSAAYINPAFMVDALKTVKGEVRLELRGSEEGVMLKAGSWQYLLMPVSPREPVNA